MSNQMPSICPRCESATVELQFASPVAGVWEIYRCTTCLYAWRTTEPETNTDPAKYPQRFKVKPEELSNYPVMPAIEEPVNK